MAHGSDGGGSIRIPAACCGVFGLKPTRGRNPVGPDYGESWSGLSAEHVLTRSVRDSAALLDLVDGPTPGEPYARPPKARPFAEEVEVDPGRLRIAFTAAPLFAGEPHPDTTAAVADAAELLRSMGHDLVEARPDFPRAELVRAYFHIVASHTALAVEQAASRAGVVPRSRDFESKTWLMAQIGRKTPAPDLVASQRAIHRAARGIAGFFESYDLLLTPTLGEPPVRVGSLDLSLGQRSRLAVLRALDSRRLLDRALEELGTQALARTPNTQLFNQTGQPACSVPLHWNEAGLPIGVQLVAPFGDEATLFRVSARLEEARPWADRLPPGLAG
jgi:amidase